MSQEPARAHERDAESGVPSAARRWFHRESISLAEIAVQTFSVVLGVLLALAIGQWSHDRDERRQVEAALLALRAEMESSRAEIAHSFEQIAKADAEMAEQAKSAASTAPRPCAEVPGWHGVVSPLLLDSAYQTAIATQTLAHMDFGQAQQVARVYAKQRDLQKYIDHVIDFLLQPGRVMTVESCRYVLAGEEKVNLEQLDSAYAEFLAQNKTAR
ncbi:hypothetical protein [Rudaea sp.]|uniref:hypothetical protein n=1 Tax=Rudaea sp. TaxID=2136325 RepID=UPI002ECFB665